MLFSRAFEGWPYQPVAFEGGADEDGYSPAAQRDGQMLQLGRPGPGGLLTLVGLLSCLLGALGSWQAGLLPGWWPPQALPTPARSRSMLEEQPGPGGPGLGLCQDSGRLSNFSSKGQMEQVGWLFGWSGRHSFCPDKASYGSSLPPTSYWGFSESVDGEIALVLRGYGFFTLNFGNSWTGPHSQVVVYLNGIPQKRAGANGLSNIVRAAFQEGDVLRLVESNGVIVINSISFECAGDQRGSIMPRQVSSESTSASTSTSTRSTSRSTSTRSTQTGTQTWTTSLTTATTTETTRTTTTVVLGTTSTGTVTSTSLRRPEPQQGPVGSSGEGLDISKLTVLRRRTESQLRSESQMSARLQRVSKQLEHLEEMERRELLKARSDLRLKEDLQEQLQRMVSA